MFKFEEVEKGVIYINPDWVTEVATGEEGKTVIFTEDQVYHTEYEPEAIVQAMNAAWRARLA